MFTLYEWNFRLLNQMNLLLFVINIADDVSLRFSHAIRVCLGNGIQGFEGPTSLYKIHEVSHLQNVAFLNGHFG